MVDMGTLYIQNPKEILKHINRNKNFFLLLFKQHRKQAFVL